MSTLRAFTGNFLNLNSFLDVVKFLLPILATYILTRYTVDNPIKKEVNQRQFTLVYLPLYKLFCANGKSKYTYDESLRLSIRLNNILQKNYELAFPQLHQLAEELIAAVDSCHGYQIPMEKITYQISLDYEILKKKLGYPHLNAWELFKRRTTVNKIQLIMSYIFVLYIFPGSFIAAASNSVSRVTLYILGFLVILLAGVKVNNMRE